MAANDSSNTEAAAPIDTAAARAANDVGRSIGDAVQGFHTIYRLATMCIGELGADAGDAEPLILAMRDLAQKHGAALDRCLGDGGLGVFVDTEAAHG